MICVTSVEPALRALIRKALEEIKLLPEGPAPLDITLEPPRNAAHGDLASSMAMQLASRNRQPPLQLAETLAGRMRQLLPEFLLGEAIAAIEVKPPGFVNVLLSPAFLRSVLREVLTQASRYGRVGFGQGKKVLVEFVSANPTGPLSVAHGRQAAVGDALAGILEFAGYRVSREYYLNDEGTQMDLLGVSVLARAREALDLDSEFPENGYKGEYVRQLGKEFSGRRPAAALKNPVLQERLMKEARRFGAGRMTEVIRGELTRFGVIFDRWFPQSSLARWGYLHRTLELLKRRGDLYQSDGAWWLKSTAFGDDKDRVVIRSDGRLTYIAADIAYHRRKFQRGFGLLVNLWGPDHHGYIARLKAAVQGMGFSPDALQIRIVQLCTLKRGAETLPMSTREGQFITLTEVMEEVGRDAARFFFLLRKMDAHLEFDLELAKKQSLENPVYYIQYADARISSIFQKAAQEGLLTRASGKADHNRLTAPEELRLLRLLRVFPGVVESCARSLEPFGLVSYLQELAEALHRFYDLHRVIGAEEPLAAARLDLVRAVQIVLGSGLKLLGLSAPEKM